jgi:hypothetical protein
MNLKKIFKAFPAPKFLNVPFAGISISDTSIRCIQFVKKNGVLHIEKYAEKVLTKGTIVGGQINNIDEITNVLNELKNSLKLTYVKMSLPEEKAYLFTAKIPLVDKDEIRSAVESKMEENVPVSPLELTFDYKLFERPEKDLVDVVVSALPISLVDSYVEMAEKAGLSLLSLEIESQAITRAVLPYGANSTALVINFSPEKVGLYVSYGRVVRFTSTISTKGEYSNNPAFLMQEIKKLYTYWHTLKENVDKPEKEISHIYICGEGFDDAMVSYIGTHSQTPTTVANVWINAFDINTTIPEIPFNESIKYAASIGLAMPSKIFI